MIPAPRVFLRTERVDVDGAPGWAQLVGMVLFLRPPRLDGAACRRAVPLHDCDGATATDPRVKRAQRMCATECPALADCRRWYLALPRDRRPHGVTAGYFRPSRTPRSDIEERTTR